MTDTPLEFLATRRSRPAKTLTGPVPDRAQIEQLLEIGARVPDHGKLEPWRFIVLNRDALIRLAGTVAPRGAALDIPGEKIAKMEDQFRRAELAIAVIASPKPSDKIPPYEQLLSAGAVCHQLLNAALASGWGANWLSGWISHDPDWCRETLGLTDGETVAGFIHIGTQTVTPPERPRPDVPSLTTWRDA